VGIHGRNVARAADFAQTYGWQYVAPTWEELVSDSRIQLLDHVGPNHAHEKPVVAAARAGKHVFCEKPLAPSAAGAYRMWTEAEQAGVVHACGFNYRFIPAIVVMRELVTAEILGEVREFDSHFVAPDPRRARPESPPVGVLHDLAVHHLDLLCWLVDLPARAQAVFRHEDEHAAETAVKAVLECRQGAVATVNASTDSRIPNVESQIRVNGTKGYVSFDLARLNELTLSTPRSVKTIPITGSHHPFMHFWYPGHAIGWADSFAHELDAVLGAISGHHQAPAELATFEDGYRVAEICEAIERAAKANRSSDVTYADRPAAASSL